MDLDDRVGHSGSVGVHAGLDDAIYRFVRCHVMMLLLRLSEIRSLVTDARFKRESLKGLHVADVMNRPLSRLCDLLSKAVAADKANGWDNEHKNVYLLAEHIMTRTMITFMSLKK